MPDIVNLHFDNNGSSIYEIEDLNTSFAKGTLKIMYTGENRNGSCINRDVVEKALPSLYNVPIVSHYIFEENAIGGHDIGIERDDSGELKFVQYTEPCGVVPESAVFEFVNEEDENGIEHEYLVAKDILLWKRQNVYSHIVNDLDGKVDHSMEIRIVNGFVDNKTNCYTITDFEFQALCLLEKVSPCFEGSELELYSAENFRDQMNQMMSEFKAMFSAINSESSENDIDAGRQNSTKGGCCSLDIEKILNEYGLTTEDVEFDAENITEEELREKCKACCEKETASEDETEVVDNEENGDDEDTADNASDETEEKEETEENHEDRFALSREMCQVLSDAVNMIETVSDYWGEYSRYFLEDYDIELSEVYCRDCETWHLVGFKYSMNGDDVVIDRSSCKRKKTVYVDFDEGVEKEMNITPDVYSKMNGKIRELIDYKMEKENEEFENKVKAIFEKFAFLSENEMFIELVNDHKGMTLDAIEDKCFSIKGRSDIHNFSEDNQKHEKVIIPVHNNETTEPYGGLFIKYGK